MFVTAHGSERLPPESFPEISGFVTFVNTHTLLSFVIKPIRCTNFTNLFYHEILHVSESSPVHHQEFIRCTLSNGICHAGMKTAFEQ